MIRPRFQNEPRRAELRGRQGSARPLTSPHAPLRQPAAPVNREVTGAAGAALRSQPLDDQVTTSLPELGANFFQA